LKKWKVDRVTVFLFIAVVSFLYDLTFYLGIRDTIRFPHPFVYFRSLGNIEYLRGFPGMLRNFIFSFVLGGLIGVGVGRLVLSSGRGTKTAIQVLSLGLWLPFLIIFATPDPRALGIAAAMFCSCYYYLVGTSVLRLEGPNLRTFVAGETTLQILLFSLISQIWLLYWKWFSFAATYQAPEGLGVFIVIVVLLMFIQWIFRIDFKLVAEQHRNILFEDLKSPTLRWMGGFLLFTLAFTVIWERVGYMRFPRWSASPLGAISAGYDLLTHIEIYIDSQASLLEMLGGIVLCGSIALIVSAFMSANSFFLNALTPLLPLSNISPMVLWLLSFLLLGRIIPDFLSYWHKVFAVLNGHFKTGH